MVSCNLVFGRTGCGKTSLKNMICGEDPELDSLVSGTLEAQILQIDSDGKRYKYVDTAGILDNRGDGEDLKKSRADKVNQIGELLKQNGLEVSRVLYCVSATERVLKEELDWLADVLQMLGGRTVLQVFAVVLTKVDAGFSKRKFEKNFEDHELVKVVKAAFANCPVVTSGYDNVESVKKLLVPVEETHSLAIKPSEIKTITPKVDLETHLKQTQAKLAEIMEALEREGSTESDIKAQVASLEEEIDSLTERITNGGWWCWWTRDFREAQDRIKKCKSKMLDLKNNRMKSDQDRAEFERQKLFLLQEIRDAEAELREKTSLFKIVTRLLVFPM